MTHSLSIIIKNTLDMIILNLNEYSENRIFDGYKDMILPKIDLIDYSF